MRRHCSVCGGRHGKSVGGLALLTKGGGGLNCWRRPVLRRMGGFDRLRAEDEGDGRRVIRIARRALVQLTCREASCLLRPIRGSCLLPYLLLLRDSSGYGEPRAFRKPPLRHDAGSIQEVVCRRIYELVLQFLAVSQRCKQVESGTVVSGKRGCDRIQPRQLVRRHTILQRVYSARA